MQRMIELLRRYGRNVHSFLVLEPGLDYWFSARGEGAVAYTEQAGYWVAAGAPVGPAADRRRLSLEFSEAARTRGCRACFFGVSEVFRKALEGLDFDALKVAEQPLWDPARWSPRGKLRNRLRRACREGVTTRVVHPDSLDRSAVASLMRAWLDAHRLPPMQFMAHLDLFGRSHLRFYLVAEKSGAMVGLGVADPIYGRRGWLLEDLLTDRSVPGAGEALIDAFMREAASRGGELASLGMVPLAGLEGSENAGHPLLHRLLMLARRGSAPLYNVDGLLRFRRKLGPQGWESVYLVTAGPVALSALRAVGRAFAGESLARFAWRVLRRSLSDRIWQSARLGSDHDQTIRFDSVAVRRARAPGTGPDG